VGSYCTEAYNTTKWNEKMTIDWGRRMNILNKHWIGICRKPEGVEDQSKPGKGPFGGSKKRQ
jgi:hypothetical protein